MTPLRLPTPRRALLLAALTMLPATASALSSPSPMNLRAGWAIVTSDVTGAQPGAVTLCSSPGASSGRGALLHYLDRITGGGTASRYPLSQLPPGAEAGHAIAAGDQAALLLAPGVEAEGGFGQVLAATDYGLRRDDDIWSVALPLPGAPTVDEARKWRLGTRGLWAIVSQPERGEDSMLTRLMYNAAQGQWRVVSTAGCPGGAGRCDGPITTSETHVLISGSDAQGGFVDVLTRDASAPASQDPWVFSTRLRATDNAPGFGVASAMGPAHLFITQGTANGQDQQILIYRRDTLSRVGALTSPHPGGLGFGRALAVNSTGNRLITSQGGAAAVIIFRSDDGWPQVRATATHTSDMQDVGVALAWANNQAIIGAPSLTRRGAPNVGDCLTINSSPNNTITLALDTQQSFLSISSESDNGWGARFGAAIALLGGRAVISAPDLILDTYGMTTPLHVAPISIDEDDGDLRFGDLVATLAAQTRGEGFGEALATDGTLLAVAAPRVKRDAQAWGEVALYDDALADPLVRVTPPATWAGQDDVGFGEALAFDGERLAVLAPRAMGSGGALGAVAIYTITASAGGASATLDGVIDAPGVLAAPGQLDVLGDRLVMARADAGEALLFGRGGDGAWSSVATLTGGEGFGATVALVAGRALVGAGASLEVFDSADGAAQGSRAVEGGVTRLQPDPQHRHVLISGPAQHMRLGHGALLPPDAWPDMSDATQHSAPLLPAPGALAIDDQGAVVWAPRGDERPDLLHAPLRVGVTLERPERVTLINDVWWTGAAVLPLEGVTQPDAHVAVTTSLLPNQPQRLTTDAGGAWSASLELGRGVQEIVVTTSRRADADATIDGTRIQRVRLDDEAPEVISLDAPKTRLKADAGELVIVAQARDQLGMLKMDVALEARVGDTVVGQATFTPEDDSARAVEIPIALGAPLRGEVLIAVVARDTVGNTSLPVSVRVIAPTATVVDLETIGDGFQTDVTDPLLTGEAPAGATVTITIDDQPPVEVVAGADGRWYYQTMNLAPGAHTVQVEVQTTDGTMLPPRAFNLTIREDSPPSNAEEGCAVSAPHRAPSAPGALALLVFGAAGVWRRRHHRKPRR